jgi:hypothetical protein
MRSARGRRMCRLFMPASPRRCPVPWGGLEVLGLAQESTYRLYNCRRCAMQVLICARCDHGNMYCGAECAQIQRRDSLRRAAARYQHTRCGAARHAARQRTWRLSHPKVTHHGSPNGALQCNVLRHQLTLCEPIDVAGVESKKSVPISLHRWCCAFCGAPLPVWTRMRLWQWNG